MKKFSIRKNICKIAYILLVHVFVMQQGYKIVLMKLCIEKDDLPPVLFQEVKMSKTPY